VGTLDHEFKISEQQNFGYFGICPYISDMRFIHPNLNDVPLASVREWERGFHEFMAASYPQVGDGIRSSKALSKELEADLRRGIEAYKKQANVGSHG